MRRILLSLAIAASIALAAVPATAQPPQSPQSPQPPQPREVTANLTLEKGAVLTTPLAIRASGITIDGNGAVICGPGRPGDKATFTGVGITATGCRDVTIRNLTVRGFERGLDARDGSGWTIHDCDFSDNYHDPDHGWGDYQRVGGVILTRMHGCRITATRAQRVWNGLDLFGCDRNRIDNCTFSHCSNVCLKLWRSCRNTIHRNDLSYGIRIRKGEVHARDSTGVLIECGSNGNRFTMNDVTHGGDGIFIRVLNGWVSTANHFEGNDCSHANNNGFEAWSPGNTYVRNKANHCSYGFWLGGSDHTTLIDNEAAHNGSPQGHHNAPEPDFGHGGIVIVNGPGSHSVIDGNWCHHNNGAGIAFRGDRASRGERWRMFHLVVQRNRLEHNRCGLFARFTDWLDCAANTFVGNARDRLLEDVTALSRREADPENRPPPVAAITGPSRVWAGERVTFDATPSRDPSRLPLHYRWSIGGMVSTTRTVKHAFPKPGFYRVGLTVHNGHLAGLAWREVYAIVRGRETATEGHAARWQARQDGDPARPGAVTVHDETDPAAVLVGKSSIRICADPYRGADVHATLRAASEPGTTSPGTTTLVGKTHLTFWLRYRNHNVGSFQGPNPIVRLHGGDAGAGPVVTYTPVDRGKPHNLLGGWPDSEARWGWVRVNVPFAGCDGWTRTESTPGPTLPHFDGDLRFDTHAGPVATPGPTGLATDGKALWLAACAEGSRLFRSPDGRHWKELTRPSRDLPGAAAGWINGMLVFRRAGAGKGSLYLALRRPEGGGRGHDPKRLARYDIATGTWSWLPTRTAMGHGAVVVGDHLFGLAHAVGGNYGGPLCRADLAHPATFDQRSTLGPLEGDNAWWMSRAAQLALAVDGRIYAIKNDWKTPQPTRPDEIGDRLLVFAPADYKPSAFAGTDRWSEDSWQAATTPVEDLGALPFEPGHGAALVALPPKWCAGVGKRGGLFILAGCSPSNHEGHGTPSDRFAIYDLATCAYRLGRLPAATGAGTSAALHAGKLYIKRGGVHGAAGNTQLWEVTPLSPTAARDAAQRVRRARLDLRRVRALSLQFDSTGWAPFSIWIDGLSFR